MTVDPRITPAGSVTGSDCSNGDYTSISNTSSELVMDGYVLR